MTVTYPNDRPVADQPHAELNAEPFVPVYARTRKSTRSRKGGVKTWMILAPVGALVLGGVAVAMIVGGGEEAPATPLVEPAATAPVLPAQPLLTEAAPLETVAPVVETAPAPAPVVRAAPAPARRTAPAAASRPAPAPAPATREAPVEPAGPQPYTSSLNTTPATPPAATPAPAPVVVIQPGS